MNTTLSLSSAIRLGATLRPQCFFQWYANGGSCAMGAAYEAVGFVSTGHGMPLPWHLWPVVRILDRIPCPACGVADVSMVAHLNDHHRLTREEIADFVEIYERQQEINNAVEVSTNTGSLRSEDQQESRMLAMDGAYK